MRTLLLLLGTACLIAGTVAGGIAYQSRNDQLSKSLQIQVEDKNPWTHLDVNDRPEQFQFAIVTDRTGGNRAGVFARAVKQINLLQPEFVVSVGDLIEGGPDTEQSRKIQWDEFQSFIDELEMPFFYVPGNHDARTSTLAEAWDVRFGRRYYWFKYQDVLFLCLNSNDGTQQRDNSGRIRYGTGVGEDQRAFVKKALAENPDTRWTVVLLHHPLWSYGDVNTNGWLDVEEQLKDREYTVFCGHIHSYRKFVRNGKDYYQLATTGGGSRMRGVELGEFDQVVWVTMKKDGPILANIDLNSVYPEDLRFPEVEESGSRPGFGEVVMKVRGQVSLDGKPLSDVVITFSPSEQPETGRPRPATGVTQGDGSYTLTSFVTGDGAKPGNYRVSLSNLPNRIEGDPRPKIDIPEKYLTTRTSGLEVEVVEGRVNRFVFELKSD